jgi:hypothetical protein
MLFFSSPVFILLFTVVTIIIQHKYMCVCDFMCVYVDYLSRQQSRSTLLQLHDSLHSWLPDVNPDYSLSDRQCHCRGYSGRGRAVVLEERWTSFASIGAYIRIAKPDFGITLRPQTFRTHIVGQQVEVCRFVAGKSKETKTKWLLSSIW